MVPLYNHNEHTGEIDKTNQGDIAILYASIIAIQASLNAMQTSINSMIGSINTNSSAIVTMQLDINNINANALFKNGYSGTFTVGTNTIIVSEGQVISIT